MEKKFRSLLSLVLFQQANSNKVYVRLLVCSFCLSLSIFSCKDEATSANFNKSIQHSCCYVGRELNEFNDSTSIASVRQKLLQYVDMSEKIPNPWVGKDSLPVHSLFYYTMHIDSIEYVYVNVRKNSNLNFVSSKMEPTYLKLIIRQKQSPKADIEIYDPALREFKEFNGSISNCWFTD